MNPAGRMQGRHSLRQLRESHAQPALVEGCTGRTRGASRSAWEGRERRCRRGLLFLVVAADIAEEANTIDTLHREEPEALFRQQLVERDQVRVGEVRQGAEFPLKTIEVGRVRRAQHLERHHGATLPIVGLVDDAEAARAEPPEDPEPIVSGELVDGLAHGAAASWIARPVPVSYCAANAVGIAAALESPGRDLRAGRRQELTRDAGSTGRQAFDSRASAFRCSGFRFS